MLHKITQLKEQGIQISDLSAHLRQSKKKPHNAFNYLITVLTSEKYIDTIEKVTNLIDGTVDVINPDDQILISNRASAALKRIGDLRNHPLVNDPSEDLAFKAFLKKCYHKNQHVDNRLVKVQKVSDQDLRISLHGQDSLVAKQKIDKGTILGYLYRHLAM